MEEIKLSDDVFEQIKDFNHKNLTKEQRQLVNELILDEKLRKRYKMCGLCKECRQPNTDDLNWCQPCNTNHFQQNFKNWTSGNHGIDEFIQNIQLKAKHYKEVLEWIEYDGFEDVKYLAEGGFGTSYKAIWKDGYIHNWDFENNQWKRDKNCNRDFTVVLKCLHDSHDITTEFLKEIGSHILLNKSYVVRCYGITREPKTNNFMMVIEYARYGNLRQHLNNHFNSFDWAKKLGILHCIANGLQCVHDSGLIHRDFHCGNILSYTNEFTLIADLGLCQPANVKPFQNDNKEVYGVLPYVDPEVLRGKEYTQASDIYGFGIIAYEVCSGLPPYYDVAHDEFLAIRICRGLRPSSDYKIPQLVLDIIKQCWDADPSKRPKAEKLSHLLFNLCFVEAKQKNSMINKQIKEADEMNKNLPSSTETPFSTTAIPSYTTHSQAVFTSRLLVYENLPKSQNAEDNDHLIKTEYLESMKIDFTMIDSKDEIN